MVVVCRKLTEGSTFLINPKCVFRQKKWPFLACVLMNNNTYFLYTSVNVSF